MFSNALSETISKHIPLSATRRETLAWLALLIMRQGTICLWRLAAGGWRLAAGGWRRMWRRRRRRRLARCGSIGFSSMSPWMVPRRRAWSLICWGCAASRGL